MSLIVLCFRSSINQWKNIKVKFKTGVHANLSLDRTVKNDYRRNDKTKN